MPITPFLPSQAFQPEQIEAMSEAFTRACKSLGLAVQSDPITALVARRVIELAQTGVHTPNALYLATMREFKPNAN